MRADADAGRAEVWVVDNGSTDRSRELVRDSYGWVNLLEPEENLGFGRAVNLVAGRAGGDWIAPANADIELAEDALERLVDAGERDPHAGVVAPRLILPDGSTQHSVHAFPTPSLALKLAVGAPSVSRGLAERLCLEGDWDPERPRYVDWAHGALLLVRRGAWDAIGGFDAEQWMYAEDIDLAWRLRERGLRVRYEPAARVKHAVSAATTKAFGDAGREQRHIAASYAWMMRRQGPVATRLAAAGNVAGAATRAAFWSVPALFASRFRGRRDQYLRYVRRHRLGLRSKAKILSAA